MFYIQTVKWVRFIQILIMGFSLILLVACPTALELTPSIDAPDSATLNQAVTLKAILPENYQSRSSVTWQWSIELMPPESNSIIDDSTSEEISLTPDKEGKYIISLTAINGDEQSAPVVHVIRIESYDFLSFGITLNGISYEGIQYGSLIWIIVPESSDLSVSAINFSLVQGTAFHQNTQLNPTSSSVDLSEPISIEIKSDDGQIMKSYTVTAQSESFIIPPDPTTDPAEIKSIDVFSIEGTLATIGSNTISQSLPYGSNFHSQIIDFQYSGMKLLINGLEVETGISALDCQISHTLSVFAWDSSVINYTLTIFPDLCSIMKEITGYDQIDGDTPFNPGGTISEVPRLSDYEISIIETPYDLWHEVLQWALVNGYNLSNDGKEGSLSTAAPEKGGLPVTSITWNDAAVWCNALSEKEGLEPVYYTDETQLIVWRNSNTYYPINRTASDAILDGEEIDESFISVKQTAEGYRLPTAVQWEYAARSISPGITTPADSHAGYPESVIDCAWYGASSGGTASIGVDYPVAQKQPNTKGLFDMSGNLSEFVWDWNSPLSGESYSNPDSTGIIIAGNEKMIRGGNRESLYDEIKLSAIDSITPYSTVNHLIIPDSLVGFRIAKGPTLFQDNSSAKMKSVIFEKSLNPFLEDDIELSIGASMISGIVPFDRLTELIATYKFTGAEVLIDSITVESGITVTDFGSAGSIQVISKNGFNSHTWMLALSEESAKTVYVSTSNGNDSNRGSVKNPFKTIEYALSASGVMTDYIQVKEIHVAAGDYPITTPISMKAGISLLGGWDSLFENRGYLSESERSDGNYQTTINYVGSDPGTYSAPVTYNYSSTLLFDGSSLVIGSDTIFEGFTLEAPKDSAYSTTIWVKTKATPVIRYNTILSDQGLNTNGAAAIRIGGECQKTLIANNKIIIGDSQQYSIGISTESETAILNNEIIQTGNHAGSLTGIRITTSAANTIVINNSIILIESTGNIHGIYNSIYSEIINNSFIIGESNLINRAIELAYGSKPRIINNLFYATAPTTGETIAIYEGYPNCEPITENNLFYGFATALMRDHDVTAPADLLKDEVELNSYPNASGNRVLDPIFEDSSNFDYRLTDTNDIFVLSGAKDQSSLAEYPIDLDGNPIDAIGIVRTGDSFTGWTIGPLELN